MFVMLIKDMCQCFKSYLKRAALTTIHAFHYFRLDTKLWLLSHLQISYYFGCFITIWKAGSDHNIRSISVTEKKNIQKHYFLDNFNNDDTCTSISLLHLFRMMRPLILSAVKKVSDVLMDYYFFKIFSLVFSVIVNYYHLHDTLQSVFIRWTFFKF